MKRRIFLIAGGAIFLIGIALSVILVCILSNDEEETQRTIDYFTDNDALEYVKWEYDGYQLDWVDKYNITSTSEKLISTTGYAEGEFIISSWEEYQNCLARIEQKEADAAMALENAKDKYKDNPSIVECFDATLYVETVDTVGLPIDEAFFDDYSLAVVDFCYRGDPYVRSRLEDIKIENDTVTVTISKYHVIASTSDQKGNVYWIPVPKECTELSVIYHATVK